MEKTELLNRLSSSPEERLLLGKTLDRLRFAGQRSVPTHTPFLSPAERAAVERLIAAEGYPAHLFTGGYPEVERRVCVFLPDWMEPEDVAPADYISALRAVWHGPENLTHRDFLGALMGMGVKRETVGDILVGKGSCDLLLLPEIVLFTLQNLTSAGRARLTLSPLPLEEVTPPVGEVKTIHATVSSLRLDAVAAAGFSTSRSKLAEAITAGRVALNWREVTRPDASVAQGDVVSCRGLGKCRVTEVGGQTRKGRIAITLERYL
ncbi:MAG: YlmH/Sll1252 family protein [Clostridiales bacterium]|nr:YlmH/Sll1252 family protein [Clostridiales bacterium]